MTSLRQLYIPIFRSKSSKLSMKSYVLAFSSVWPCCKRSRSTQGHNFNTLDSTQVPNATYQVSRPSVNRFWRRRFLKVFTIYGHSGHVGHVTRTVGKFFHSLNPWRLYIKFGHNWPSGFRGDCLKSSKYERSGSKVTEWPWPLVLTHLHILIKMTVYTNF